LVNYDSNSFIFAFEAFPFIFEVFTFTFEVFTFAFVVFIFAFTAFTYSFEAFVAFTFSFHTLICLGDANGVRAQLPAADRRLRRLPLARPIHGGACVQRVQLVLSNHSIECHAKCLLEEPMVINFSLETIYIL
jgi:hypothetical protein